MDANVESYVSAIEGDGPSTMTIESDPLCLSQTRTIMSICTAASRCGCAIYTELTLHLIADRRDPGDPYKGLDIIIQRVDPSIVIVPAPQKQLITFLEKRFVFKVVDVNGTTSTTDDAVDPAFTLVIAPNYWFSISSGEQKLIDSEWVNNKGFTDPEQRSFFVFSRIKKSIDVCAIRAIAAIDRYMGHEFTINTCRPDAGGTLRVHSEFESSSGQQMDKFKTHMSQATTTEGPPAAENLMPILDAKYIDPGPVLSVDKATLHSLGIFPKSFTKNPQQLLTDQGDPDIQVIPSLFEVLSICQSSQGKKNLRTMMMWPLQEMDELHHRHEAIDFFIRPENRLFREQLVVQLKNTVPLSGLLAKLNQSVGTYKEISIVYRSMWSFMAIIDLIKSNMCEEIEILNRLTRMDSPSLREATDSIMNIIDFEASKRERRIQVCTGVDEDVDEKKEIVRNLMKFCDEVAIQETAKYKDVLGKPCRVLYIPRIGFLNSIDYTSTTELNQISANKEFEVLLHTEQSVYFKTSRMDELDDGAGDIACDLIDVQEKVVVDLQNEILKHSEVILKFIELCGELDCLVAFAIVSSQRGYIRPDMVSAGEVIEIREAYHPLHCMRYNVIPNDIIFYKETAERAVKVMVLTGPNSCGKTTYMKAACLVVYMAHIGCFVPALYARIPIVDAILTRIHSANSISTGLSSFATDLHQINYALGRATDRSLIAIDEFGKGTNARDGFHLLKGLVRYFANRGSHSPYVMISTHYNRLIDHLHSHNEFILYKTFKVSRDPFKDTVIYEFKLTDGVSESSLADQVAIKAGIPQAIITRANEIRDHITEGRQIRPRPPHAA